jgi:hypothetical protein
MLCRYNSANYRIFTPCICLFCVAIQKKGADQAPNFLLLMTLNDVNKATIQKEFFEYPQHYQLLRPYDT